MIALKDTIILMFIDFVIVLDFCPIFHLTIYPIVEWLHSYDVALISDFMSFQKEWLLLIPFELTLLIILVFNL